MKGALKKLRKLRGRSLDELRVRGAQLVAARAERVGLGARLPTDAGLARLLNDAPARPDAAALLEHFRRAPRPFFAAFADPARTREVLRRRFAQAHGSPLLDRAARAARGSFDLLGLRALSFGEPVDWNYEPVAGKRAPMCHWSRIPELDPAQTGDKKIIWELNRHQHFYALGRAYWHASDEAHAAAFAAHLDSWMSQHPPKRGVNWMSSLEVAFRTISWLWALHFFKDSPRLTPALYARALKYLYLQGRHLETFLSTYYSPNTHLTGEALGLYYLGTALPELRRAAGWRERGRRVLLDELDRQIRPDGVYFEQTSYYLRYTADFYTHFLLLARAAGDRAAEGVAATLSLMLDHLAHLTAPDGTTPFYGDDDGGRLAPLDDRPPADFRATVATGAALFARADYKHVAGEPAEATLWLAGADGLAAFDALDDRPPAEGSRAFAHGGYYVMRDGWAPDSNYLVLDCGPHGTEGGHAHADALALTAAARGRTLLVDPGTYSYTGSPEMREYFRHTAAHNTLVVDGEPSSVPAGPFSWSRAARCEPRAWLTHARFDFFEGAHDGYERLPDPVTHARSVLFLKGDYWVVRDEARARGRHRYELYFHLAGGAAPQVENEDEDGRAVRVPGGEGGPGLELHARGAGGRWRSEEGWVSPCYGARARAPVCVFEAEAEGTAEFVTFVVPRAAGAARARLVSHPADEPARLFELADDELGASDFLVLNGAGGLVSAGPFVTDFAWAWARLARGGALGELVLVGGGSRFSFDGEELLASPRPLSHTTARAVGGGLRFEPEPAGVAGSRNGDGGALGPRDNLSKDRCGVGAERAAGR